MQEVRRFYPFVPFLGGRRVRSAFQWRGHRFEPGTLVLIDVYGTNHDPALWRSPERFQPERFRDWRGDPFSFIPQGGGPVTGHRCPGERLTVHSLALALHFLTRGVTYQLTPGQDLGFDLARMPTYPRGGVALGGVRATAQLDDPAPPLPSPAFAGEAAAGEADDAPAGEESADLFRGGARVRHDGRQTDPSPR